MVSLEMKWIRWIEFKWESMQGPDDRRSRTGKNRYIFTARGRARLVIPDQYFMAVRYKVRSVRYLLPHASKLNSMEFQRIGTPIMELEKKDFSDWCLTLLSIWFETTYNHNFNPNLGFDPHQPWGSINSSKKRIAGIDSHFVFTSSLRRINFLTWVRNRKS